MLKESNLEGYLDLSQDQVVPGGLTGEMIAKYIESGYRLTYAPSDLPATVQFKNPTGQPYYKTGIIKSGTPCLLHPNTNHIKICSCGNPSVVVVWPKAYTGPIGGSKFRY